MICFACHLDGERRGQSRYPYRNWCTITAMSRRIQIILTWRWLCAYLTKELIISLYLCVCLNLPSFISFPSGMMIRSVYVLSMAVYGTCKSVHEKNSHPEHIIAAMLLHPRQWAPSNGRKFPRMLAIVCRHIYSAPLTARYGWWLSENFKLKFRNFRLLIT